jgi:hypothetical protein
MALLPMVAVMMIGSPISGTLVNRLGSAKLISFGMIVAGLGVLLFMRADVNGSYLDLVPSYMVMGLGMSFIFAPMTTAVLNSVDSSRSGVASAVNGAIREVGNAFGIAFLGTMMNRAYQNQFDSDPQVQAVRGDSSLSPIQGFVDQIGSGMSFGGRVVQDAELFPGLSNPVVNALSAASGDAFMVGMDRAIIISAGVIFATAILSYFMIKESPVVVEQPFLPDETTYEEYEGVAAD